jgi:lambda repressor-like predicted transcriptional regulator
MIKLAVTTHGASLREVSQAAGLAPVAIKRILRQQLAGELA